MTEPLKLSFPKLTKISLNHFSLYSLKPRIDLEISDGVFCLAGANGLGKSTFLAAVNFCFTGAVPNPADSFQGLEDLLQDRSTFSNNYFSGRITEKDRKAAEISIDFKLHLREYSITRGIFEPNGLREFTIYEGNRSQRTRRRVLDTSNVTSTKRQNLYAKHLTEDIGLDSFEQFVFLQHFVFTFDERRELVFWTPKVLERALYLAFAVDPNLATRADKVRREMEKEGSHARNTTQEAKNVAERIKFIESELSANSLNDPVDYDLVARLEKLSNERDAIQALVFSLGTDLSDAELKLSNLSATQLSLRSEYETEFDKHVRSSSLMALNPIVTNSIDQGQCGLCGSQAPSITEGIKLNTSRNACPLCDSAITKHAAPDSVRTLKQIDKKLNKTKAAFDEAYALKQRITSNIEESGRQLSKAEKGVKEFERANSKVLERLKLAAQTPTELTRSLERLRERWNELDEKKKRHYEKRDEKKAKLVELQRKLSKKYVEAEKDFVPLFGELATSFIGIPLDVNLEAKETKTETGVGLVLTLKDSTRRHEYQLSESQKYFIDIALRMALAQHMSQNENEATLFIDTPEGSLDIAYEKGAGDMFARFVKSGHHILMTANINTSQILRTLAEDCGRSKMKVQTMLTWSVLSSIQKQDPQLFTKTLKQIQDKLRASKSRGN